MKMTRCLLGAYLYASNAVSPALACSPKHRSPQSPEEHAENSVFLRDEAANSTDQIPDLFADDDDCLLGLERRCYDCIFDTFFSKNVVPGFTNEVGLLPRCESRQVVLVNATAIAAELAPIGKGFILLTLMDWAKDAVYKTLAFLFMPLYDVATVLSSKDRITSGLKWCPCHSTIAIPCASFFAFFKSLMDFGASRLCRGEAIAIFKRERTPGAKTKTNFEDVGKLKAVVDSLVYRQARMETDIAEALSGDSSNFKQFKEKYMQNADKKERKDIVGSIVGQVNQGIKSILHDSFPLKRPTANNAGTASPTGLSFGFDQDTVGVLKSVDDPVHADPVWVGNAVPGFRVQGDKDPSLKVIWNLDREYGSPMRAQEKAFDRAKENGLSESLGLERQRPLGAATAYGVQNPVEKRTPASDRESQVPSLLWIIYFFQIVFVITLALVSAFRVRNECEEAGDGPLRKVHPDVLFLFLLPLAVNVWSCLSWGNLSNPEGTLPCDQCSMFKFFPTLCSLPFSLLSVKKEVFQECRLIVVAFNAILPILMVNVMQRRGVMKNLSCFAYCLWCILLCSTGFAFFVMDAFFQAAQQPALYGIPFRPSQAHLLICEGVLCDKTQWRPETRWRRAQAYFGLMWISFMLVSIVRSYWTAFKARDKGSKKENAEFAI